MEGRRLTGHVTSPEKMHRGAIAPYWIITAWIGIPRSGVFPLPSPPQAGRARPRPQHQARARARRPARTYATRGAGMGTPHSAYVRDPRAGDQRARTGGEEAKLGGEEGLCFRRPPWCRNILYGAARGSARMAWHGTAPDQQAAGDGYSLPWAPD